MPFDIDEIQSLDGALILQKFRIFCSNHESYAFSV